MNFICHHCNSSYSKKFNLQRHIIRIHFNDGSDNENKKRTNRILCCECDSNFHCFSEYHRHLEFHHHVALNTTTSTFNNISEFQKWKMNIEKETLSAFSQTTSAKKQKSGAVLYYFFCHRSFRGKIHKRKTENKKKSTGSVKIAKSCPAMMKAMITNSTVQVEYCSTHLGHECDIGRLRLSIEDRKLLAEKLIAGVSPRGILADIREKAPPTNKDRIHFVAMNDLYNIKKAYGIQCQRLQHQENKNDDVSPKEFQEIIFHSPTEQNNSPNDQEIDCEPTNDDSLRLQQLEIKIDDVSPKEFQEIIFHLPMEQNNSPNDQEIDCKPTNDDSLRLQQLEIKNDDVSPKEFQEIIFHLPMEQNNSPNNQEIDCKPTNDDSLRLQQLEMKNDDVSPKEFQEIIFHLPMEQNNSPNDQEIDCKPTNDDSEQPNIEKRQVMSRMLAISNAIATAKLSTEQLSKIMKHLDDISAEISNSSLSKETRSPSMAPNKNTTKQSSVSTKKQTIFIPLSSNSKIVIQGLSLSDKVEEIEHVYSFYEY